jgi:hypothetical protein
MALHLAFLFVVAILGCGSAAFVGEQSLQELARRHARSNPGAPLEQPAPPDEYAPRTVEEVVRDADLVLEATLTQPESYVPQSGDRVLTNYSMVAPRVISGSVPVAAVSRPGATTAPLVLTVYGGELTLEGVRVRGTDQNRDAIKSGGRYVVILRSARGGRAGQYELYYGGIFEIAGGKVHALHKKADTVFKGSVDGDVATFISRIQSAKGLN